MELNIGQCTDEQIRDFCTWKYQPPYERYSLSPSDHEHYAALLSGEGNESDPYISLLSICDAEGTLIAFATIGNDGQVPGGNYADACIDIGLAVRPELTGRGLGTSIIALLVQQISRRFPGLPQRVTIADFNRRAVRVWSFMGFELKSSFQSRNSGEAFSLYVRFQG